MSDCEIADQKVAGVPVCSSQSSLQFTVNEEELVKLDDRQSGAETESKSASPQLTVSSNSDTHSASPTEETDDQSSEQENDLSEQLKVHNSEDVVLHLEDSSATCRSDASVICRSDDSAEEKKLDETLRIKYSRDQLLKLMDVPTSRAWPVYFDIALQKPQGKIDLEKWWRSKHDSSQRVAAVNGSSASVATSTNTQSERLPDASSEVKKTKDPRERIKQEQDGIVLSPQRRSFGTGCHVLQQGPLMHVAGNGSESAIERAQRDSHRELPPRRIGSGRIIRREDSDQLNINDRRRERDVERENDQRRDHKDWRNKNESRYERDDRHDKRRRFFDDDDKRNDRRDGRDRRYDTRRPSRELEEETPEWFTGGPSSQNEFIELVGFEEAEEGNDAEKPKQEKRRSKKEKDGGSLKNSRSNTPVVDKEEEQKAEVRGQKEEGAEMEVPPPQKMETQIVIEPPPNDQDVMQFNIEDYLGDILNIGSDEIMKDSGGGSSRLKQFFKDRESPSQQSQNTPSASGCVVSNLLGFAEPVIHIPSPPNTGLDSTHFFAPISPADKTGVNAIADLFCKANSRKIEQPVVAGSGRLPPPSVRELLMGGKGQSLEEIESALRNGLVMANAGEYPRDGHNMATMAGYPRDGQRSAGVAPPQIPRLSGNTQRNPFNDFLCQVSQGQKKLVAEQDNESDKVLAKLLKDSIANKVSSMTRKGQTEIELIARLVKDNNFTRLNGGTPLAMMNGSIPPQRPPPSQHPMQSFPSNMTPHSPSRSHMMPPQSVGANRDLMKLMQSQQMQQQFQNQKKQILHPNYQQQQQAQQVLDPIKQLIGGMNNFSISHSVNQPQDSSVREALLRPDVQHLLQRVFSGQIKDAQLVAQLNSRNITIQQREAISAVLKFISGVNNHGNTLLPPRTTLTPSPTPQGVIGGGLTLGTTPSSLSPRVTSPNPEAANLLAPHMIPQPSISPLMFSGGNLHANTPRRPPSHQELVVHAQGILQKALLKQELEKAKEKHRKREAERARSPNPMGNGQQMHSGYNAGSLNIINRCSQDGSPGKAGGVKCQSPLAFTPTSVMRKMTAEKDRNEMSCNSSHRGDSMYFMPNNVSGPNPQHHGPNLKVDNCMHRIPSPNPLANSLANPLANSVLGPKAQMVMNGQNPGLLNMAAPPPHGMANQRHMGMQPNMALCRPNQQNMNNIRVLQQAQAQAALNQHFMRNTPSNMHTNPPHHSMQTRMPHPLQHPALSNNNNNFKQVECSLQIPTTSGHTSHGNSPVTLMNLFGSDVMAQVQAGVMPELPGGKALSLEEVEKL